MYRQQPFHSRSKAVDLDNVRASIDVMFPKNTRANPTPAAKALTDDEIRERAMALIPENHKFKTFSQDSLLWIATPATAKGAPVKAFRVSQALGGGGLRKVEVGVPADPQGFVDSHGGSLELQNDAGRVVGKFSPGETSNLNFI